MWVRIGEISPLNITDIGKFTHGGPFKMNTIHLSNLLICCNCQELLTVGFRVSSLCLRIKLILLFINKYIYVTVSSINTKVQFVAFPLQLVRLKTRLIANWWVENDNYSAIDLLLKWIMIAIYHQSTRIIMNTSCELLSFIQL